MARKYFYIGWMATVLLAGVIACNKTSNIYDNPYGGGKNVIQIDFVNTPPTPANGQAGQTMTFSVKGLKPEMKDKMTFLANGMTAAISGFTDSTITIVLPENVSSGGASLRVDGQVFLGPSFTIRGKLIQDATFNAGTGTDPFGSISQVVPVSNGNFVLVGAFRTYQGKEQRGMVQINGTGGAVSGFSSGTGANNGYLLTLLPLPSGEFAVGGFMSSYNSIKGLNGIAVLNRDASVKTRIVNLYVSPGVSDPCMATDTVSYYQGNLMGSVSKLHYFNNQITAVGGFTRYGTYFYERSTKDNKQFAYIDNLQLARMDLDGNLDSAYSYNTITKAPLPAGNGAIINSYMQPDGKLILVGDFTTFRGKTVNHIVRLNTDGAVDGSFNTGSGANGAIYSIQYNAGTKKFVLAGEFSRFNDQAAAGMVVLDAQGNTDAGFKSAGFTSGIPTRAKQLSNGLIVVTGSFDKYNNITRQGLMVLNPDGTLAAGYNATGKLNGFVNDIVETKSGIGGMPAVILVGLIDTFEGKTMGNIMKLVFNN